MTVHEFLDGMSYTVEDESFNEVEYLDIKDNIYINICPMDGEFIEENILTGEYFEDTLKKYGFCKVKSFEFISSDIDGSLNLTLYIDLEMDNFKWLLQWEDSSAIFDTKDKADDYFKRELERMGATSILKEDRENYRIYSVTYWNGEIDDVILYPLEYNP